MPQPKVYEMLRRLAGRGAVIQTSDHPARYAAVPADALLRRLEREFADRLRSARDGLAALATGDGSPQPSVVKQTSRRRRLRPKRAPRRARPRADRR